jgi:hypothetical protein
MAGATHCQSYLLRSLTLVSVSDIQTDVCLATSCLKRKHVLLMRAGHNISLLTIAIAAFQFELSPKSLIHDGLDQHTMV